MEDKLIRLTVNGRDEAVVIRPLATLQDVLRDNLELNAVKSGCSQGGCGSCSVLVDGELQLSCLTLAERAEGAEVTTLEGLNETNAIVPLQEAFVENYAAQCGYCTA
ncbi:MAG: 2Fe-2S iron-sulfur cluster-binding protein, partial [Rhodospirillales bacterium]|nr:2Fe-2S iron-sulfur cluster-binding protein [Rhodospirillales bacterium]